MEIKSIVITGGPCGGKSSAVKHIKDYFEKEGFAVIFVAETATELINAGVAPWNFSAGVEFQKTIMSLQLKKEETFLEAAKKLNAQKVLIVFDRGCIDNKIYMSPEEFSEVLLSVNKTETQLRDSYGAVFHLVSAAKGAEEFYTTSNNSARTETPEQAAALDDNLIDAWTGHPHLRIIDNSTDFEGKMHRLIKEISTYIGCPEPFEIERKFLIEHPDEKSLETMFGCKKVEIMQTYLNCAEGEEVRIRQRGLDGEYTFFLTEKRSISDVKRVETERIISKDEYLKHLMNADTAKRQIRKDRYCLCFEGQYFEIDIYPFMKETAIVELELSDENTEIRFPDIIKVIKEVTDDPAYKNSKLAEVD